MRPRRNPSHRSVLRDLGARPVARPCARANRVAAQGCATASGSTARTSVPAPGGLSTLSVPSTRADAVGEPAQARAAAGVARRRCRRRAPRRRGPSSSHATRTVACAGLGVLGDVGQRLGDREVGGRLDRAAGAGRSGSVDDLDRAPARGRRARRSPAARPRSVSTAGWMPRASSRSSADASCELVAEALEERRRRRPGPWRAGARATRTSSASDDEPLLRAVVQVALDLAPRGVGGLDDARARRAQLLRARRLDLVRAAAPPRPRGAR